MTKIKDLDKYDTLLDVQRSDHMDIKYEIRWSKDHGYFCECPGWQGSRVRPKICKHIKRFRFKEQVQGLLDNKKEYFTSVTVLNIAKEIWKGII